jgi:hypothetical protein
MEITNGSHSIKIESQDSGTITVERAYSMRYLSAADKEQQDRWIKILVDNPDLAEVI